MIIGYPQMDFIKLRKFSQQLELATTSSEFVVGSATGSYTVIEMAQIDTITARQSIVSRYDNS